MRFNNTRTFASFSVDVGLALLFVGAIATAAAQSSSTDSITNKERVEATLSAWKKGTGDLLPLLDDNVKWTIPGHSLGAGTTIGKTQLLDKILKPFGARFSSSAEKFKPSTIRGIYEDGDTVIATFDGYGISNDGKPYANTYLWILKMRGGKVIEATAFFDAIAFDDLWTRVTPTS